MYAAAWYAASAEELEIVGCFLARKGMRLEPKKPANPVVERHVLGQPAQSVSQKAT